MLIILILETTSTVLYKKNKLHEKYNSCGNTDLKMYTVSISYQ